MKVIIALLVTSLAFTAIQARPFSDLFDKLFLGELFDFPKIENGNTTSTVEIENGHRIETNETVYEGDSVFQIFKTIVIRPVEESEEVDKKVKNDNGNPVTSAPTAANGAGEDSASGSDERREPLEKTKTADDNEINRDIDGPQLTTSGPRIKAETESRVAENREKKEQSEAASSGFNETKLYAAEESTVADQEAAADEKSEAQTPADQESMAATFSELSTLLPATHEAVVQLHSIEAADSTEHPDATALFQREDIDSGSEDVQAFTANPVFHAEWENEINNDIDIYDTLPIDLTHDVHVNRLAAADPNFPLNPDAELIDVLALGSSRPAELLPGSINRSSPV